MSSYFCISLDFEKKWGMLDKDIPNYDDSLRNVDEVISELLNIFNDFNVRVTWAVVGMLLNSNVEEFKIELDKHFINYDNNRLEPSQHIDFKHFDSVLYSGIDSARKILTYKGNEIASHSYFHSYFNEDGLESDSLVNDKVLFDYISKNKLSILTDGIIFPRNQVPNMKIPYKYYRGNLDNYFDKGYCEKELSLSKKILRTLDCYIPLRKCRSCIPTFDEQGVLFIPATRFLRPYSSFINKLMIHRILNEMTWAAKNNDYYHLWWHPHNFGTNTNENILNLKIILKHFEFLRDEYGMESVNMNDIYNKVRYDLE